MRPADRFSPSELKRPVIAEVVAEAGRVPGLLAEVERLTSELGVSERRVEALEAVRRTVVSQGEELESLRDANARLSADQTGLCDDLRNAQNERDELRGDWERLTTELATRRESERRVADALARVDAERDALRAEYADSERDWERETAEAMAERDALRDAVTKVQAEAATAGTEQGRKIVLMCAAALAGAAPTEPKATTPESDARKSGGSLIDLGSSSDVAWAAPSLPSADPETVREHLARVAAPQPTPEPECTGSWMTCQKHVRGDCRAAVETEGTRSQTAFERRMGDHPFTGQSE